MSRTVAVALPVPRLGLLTYVVPDGVTLAPGVRVSVPLGRRTATGFVVALDPPTRRRRRCREPQADPARHRRDAAGAAAVHRAGAVGRRVLRGRTGRDAGADAAARRARARSRVQDHPHRRAHAGRTRSRGGDAAPAGRARRARGARRTRADPRAGRRRRVRGHRRDAGEEGPRDDRDRHRGSRSAGQPARPGRAGRRAAARRDAHRRAAGGAGAARRAGGGAALRGRRPARRHGQRQDAGLPAARRRRAQDRPARAHPRAGDRADAGDGRAAARARSAIRSRSSTARSRPASATISGIASAAATCRWWSARAPRCSRRSRISASSSSTKSTTRPTSRTRARAITAATSRSCARSRPARWPCSARRRRRSRRSSTRRAATTRWSRSSAASSIGRWRRSASSTCARCSRPRGPTRCSARRCARRWWRRLADGEQSVVLLNRRGYAAAYFCRACAASLECPHCSITLTVHRAARRAVCHYCDHERPLPPACPSCGGEFLDYRGVGTERIEAEVQAALPGARIARVDRDTTRRRGAIDSVLRRFAARELDVLVGTQMIAKGHDFPEVTLVGVVSADIGLGVADFRAAERTFQLLTQVVGRAGRGTRPRRGDHPDALPAALRRRARGATGLRRVLRGRADLPAGDALPADAVAGEHRGAVRRRGRRDAGRHDHRARAPRRPAALRGARSGGGAAAASARRLPRSGDPEGHETGGDAPGGAAGAGAASGAGAADDGRRRSADDVCEAGGRGVSARRSARSAKRHRHEAHDEDGDDRTMRTARCRIGSSGSSSSTLAGCSQPTRRMITSSRTTQSDPGVGVHARR